MGGADGATRGGADAVRAGAATAATSLLPLFKWYL